MKADTALIIIDMINKLDFEGSEDLLINTEPIIEPLLNLKQNAKKCGVPAIYVNDNFGLWREDLGSIIKECKKGIGKDFVKKFIPKKDDFFIIKPKHSGFYETQLNTLLKQMEVKNLIITGIAGDICVIFTAFDAYMREYNLWVPKDCLASEVTEDNDNALKLINRSMFANIDSSQDITIQEAFNTK